MRGLRNRVPVGRYLINPRRKGAWCYLPLYPIITHNAISSLWMVIFMSVFKVPVSDPPYTPVSSGSGGILRNLLGRLRSIRQLESSASTLPTSTTDDDTQVWHLLRKPAGDEDPQTRLVCPRTNHGFGIVCTAPQDLQGSTEPYAIHGSSEMRPESTDSAEFFFLCTPPPRTGFVRDRADPGVADPIVLSRHGDCPHAWVSRSF